MFQRYDRNNTPATQRLCDLTLSMIGGTGKTRPNPSFPHPGCTMKTKAAETRVVMNWAIDLVNRCLDIAMGDEVLAAGKTPPSSVGELLLNNNPGSLVVETGMESGTAVRHSAGGRPETPER